MYVCARSFLALLLSAPQEVVRDPLTESVAPPTVSVTPLTGPAEGASNTLTSNSSTLATVPPVASAALFAIVVVVLKFVVGAIAGNIVVWYLKKVFMLHAWPRLPYGLPRFLLKLKNRVPFARAPHDQAATHNDNESAFSRKSHRHPHW